MCVFLYFSTGVTTNLINNAQVAVAVDIDIRRRLAYVTDVGTKKIVRLALMLIFKFLRGNYVASVVFMNTQHLLW